MSVERVTHRDIEQLDADTVAGEKILSFKVTLAGSAPHSILFKDQGLLPMADANYRILVGGETASVVHVDESSITEAGFDLLHGVAAEIVHVLVQGVQATE
ncbi:MAG: hypothetical protein MUC88_00085 [Planctomycetes bacterium]|jgi:hypothetical protein|nr:hypothetical protein [Planctomycetota bacterium]